MTKDFEIKELKSIADFVRIHNMYDSLSDRTKYFFNYPVFSWRPIGINSFYWILGNIALFISLSPFKKFIWLLFPKAYYLIVGAFASSELIGVCFLFKFSRYGEENIAKSFGIVVKDEYQGKGVGSKLLEYLFYVASSNFNVVEVHLEVLEDNERAIKFYRRHNFTPVSYVMRAGERYLKMKKNLCRYSRGIE